MATTLKTAIKRIKSFFKKCVETNICYIYFKCDRNRDCVPMMREMLREWNVNNQTVYSVVTGNGWSYTYEKSDLKRIVYVDSASVVSFEKPSHGAPIEESFATYAEPRRIEGTIGDHITIGIGEDNNPNDLFVPTHRTFYMRPRGRETHYRRRSVDCDLLLSSAPISNDTICEDASETISTKYTDTFTVPIIQHIMAVYKGTQTGGSAAIASRKHTYNGKEYVVHRGPREGRYLKIGARRKYIGGSNRLTYKGVGFDDAFVAFLHTNVMSEVARRQPGIEGITIIYDQESELGEDCNKYVYVMYEFEVVDDMMTFYHIDALKALMAFYAHQQPVRSRTAEEKTCLQQFMTDSMLRIGLGRIST